MKSKPQGFAATTNMRVQCSDSQGLIRPQINGHQAASPPNATSNGPDKLSLVLPYAFIFLFFILFPQISRARLHHDFLISPSALNQSSSISSSRKKLWGKVQVSTPTSARELEVASFLLHFVVPLLFLYVVLVEMIFFFFFRRSSLQGLPERP